MNMNSDAYHREDGHTAEAGKGDCTVLLPEKPGAYRYVKRFFDLLMATAFLFLALPLFLFIALLIKLSSPGKVLFRQTRMGQNGKPFKIYKFRTMTENAPPDMATRDFSNSDQYITRVGRLLRCTSLDELPQLFNILIGNMSFIGPRPLVLSEKEIHALRLSKGVYHLKPGISGLAQINGRDDVEPEEKVRLDEEYLRSFSFRTDVKIYLETIAAVLCQKGFSDGHRNLPANLESEEL
jgi:O-antigen biosynthesis protein WbqP